jgi:hypothetical protein
MTSSPGVLLAWRVYFDNLVAAADDRVVAPLLLEPAPGQGQRPSSGAPSHG